MRYCCALLAVAIGLGASTLMAAVDTSADSPKDLALVLARKAGRAQKAGEFAQAYIYYSEASALQPASRKYRSRMELLQTRASSQAKPAPVVDSVPAAPVAALITPPITPEDTFDSMTEREMANARPLNAVPALHARPGRQDFNLNEDARGLFDKVAAAFGIETVYDGDYPKTGVRIPFRITSADYREALLDLQAATGSFVIPLSGHVFMVARDTQARRNDLEQTIAIAIPVPQVLTTQELTEIAQVVRQTTNVEKIGWDTAHSEIVIRDRVSRVEPALALLQQLFSYRPEVMIEMEFLQVASSDLINYGFNVTSSFSGVYLGHILNNIVASPAGVTNLLTFGGGRTLIGIGVAQAQAMFNQTTSISNSLYRAEIRSIAGQPATLHVGEKYPIINSGFVGSVPAGQQGQVFAPPPSFTFEDLGLEMKVTPFVHGMGEVTLALETSFEVLTGQTVNDIPILGNRKLVSQVRLRNDEWAVIGGLMNTTRSKGVSGFWGLAQIPLLGNLFKQTTLDKEDNNVLIGIRPHLLSLPPDQIAVKPLRVGSDIHPYTPL
jgi:general secretion pathway protein D